MKNRIIIFLLLVCSISILAEAQTENSNEIKWLYGASVGNLGGKAEIQIPEGYIFAGANDTRVIMEAYHNPTSGNELGFIAPDSMDWFVVFEFSNTGYIKDDEKNSLDADAILESIKEGTEAGNEIRKQRGWAIMTILGWEIEPSYNERTHNLEWATRAESNGNRIINFNTRLLGRLGVMEVTLVTDPKTLGENLPKFNQLMSGFTFKQGQKYTEFVQGDKVAEYGLTGLVVGGAAAVAAKTGIFKWLWKFLVVAGAAIVGYFKKFFSRKNSTENQ